MLQTSALLVCLAVAMNSNIYAQQPLATSLDSRSPPETAHQFIIGADISWVQAAEDRGIRFSDNGVQKDILEILKDHGVPHPAGKQISKILQRAIRTCCS